MAVDIDLSTIVPIYQSYMDWIISSSGLGKQVTLYFDETVSNVSNDFVDINSDQDTRKPDFKLETSTAPTITENSVTIYASIEYNPKDFVNYGIEINQDKTIVMLKTLLTDVPNIKRAKFMVPSFEIKDVIRHRYRLLREPIPQGLKEDRYAISFWMSI